MIYNYQYRLRPTTDQKLVLNDWLRICRYWFNKQLGERYDWWQKNRSSANSCSIIQCELPKLKARPEFYGQKKQLPIIKKEKVLVEWSGESLDFSSCPSQSLQEVCKRVKLAFTRFTSGDSNGKRSGKPRFKSQANFKSMVFEGAKLHSSSVGPKGYRSAYGKWLYLSLPKLGIIKARHHRPIPDGATLKQVQVIKKVDSWYINLRLHDDNVPEFDPSVVATWDNSLGMDAVLKEDDYLATSEGVKLPSLKAFRKSQGKLTKISIKKNARKKGSKSRRKLAKKEAKLHGKIARARRDHAFKTAHTLLRTGKKIFFYEKLNLKGLSRRNKPKKNELGNYIPNRQASKSGLNKSWSDAAFGEFFKILDYIAEKAGAVAIPVNPAYTSQLLSYKDEFVFIDLSVREYWDKELQLKIDRDINSAINVKRVGLDLFPTISKRRKGSTVVTNSVTHTTLKEVLSTLRSLEKPALYASRR